MCFNDPLVLDIINRDDLDFILFDAEHGYFDTLNIAHHMQICRLMGLPSFVRVPQIRYHFISRALDMGTDGIMLPRVEKLEQIEVALNALLFYPEGKKGYAGHFMLRKGEKFEDYKKTRFLLPQIESKEGIEVLPEMLEKYGEYISAIIIGPCDLSIMIGKPLDLEDSEHKEYVQKIFDICKKYNKSCGIYCDSPERAEKYRKMGANVLWSFTDVNCFKKGYNDLMDEITKLK